jgi:hypothetical protein
MYHEDSVYQVLYDLGLKLKKEPDAWTELIYKTDGFELEVFHDYDGIWGIELNGDGVSPPTNKYPRDIYNEVKLLIRNNKLKRILK